MGSGSSNPALPSRAGEILIWSSFPEVVQLLLLVRVVWFDYPIEGPFVVHG